MIDVKVQKAPTLHSNPIDIRHLNMSHPASCENGFQCGDASFSNSMVNSMIVEQSIEPKNTSKSENNTGRRQTTTKFNQADIMYVNTAHSMGCAPVMIGAKGLCYDLEKVCDDKLRSRLQKNRRNAQESRARQLKRQVESQAFLAKLEAEVCALSAANDELRKLVWQTESAIHGLGHCSSHVPRFSRKYELQELHPTDVFCAAQIISGMYGASKDFRIQDSASETNPANS
jgi:hypothetical protein